MSILYLLHDPWCKCPFWRVTVTFLRFLEVLQSNQTHWYSILSQLRTINMPSNGAAFWHVRAPKLKVQRIHCREVRAKSALQIQSLLKWTENIISVFHAVNLFFYLIICIIHFVHVLYSFSEIVYKRSRADISTRTVFTVSHTFTHLHTRIRGPSSTLLFLSQ